MEYILQFSHILSFYSMNLQASEKAVKYEKQVNSLYIA